jgi:hypothetical protein
MESVKKLKAQVFKKTLTSIIAMENYVWTELRYDPRWIRKDKNVIVVLDEQTQRKKSIEPEKTDISRLLSTMQLIK